MKFSILFSAFLFGSVSTQYSPPSENVQSSSSVLDNTAPSKFNLKIDVPKFPTADVQKLSFGSIDNKATQQNIKKTLDRASTQISFPVISFESLFTRHPSKNELIKFANDADVAAISRTLQNLATDDSVPCQAKVSFLLQLLGLLKTAISKKSLATNQLETIINGAKKEILRLQNEIARVQDDRKQLNLNQLNNQLNQIVGKLRPLYDQINTVKNKIPPEEARIAGYQKEIAALSKQNDQERNRLSNDRLKLTIVESRILELEDIISQTIAQKQALQSSIAASDNVIRENNNKIIKLRKTITQIQGQVRKLQDTLDKLKRQTNSLQVDQQRSRTDLSVALAQDKILLDQTKIYEDKINQQQPKLVDDQLRNIKVLIGNLNQSKPQVQGEIDRQFYYCYGDQKIQSIKADNDIVYVIKGQSFGQYIQSAYGQIVKAPNIKFENDYKLRVVDPFSKIWTAKYGFPLVTEARGSFSCYSQETSANFGLITSISNNGITVKDSNGQGVNLLIGRCSRIESTEELPRVGQTIAWRGVPSSVGGYNIYTATCFE